MEATGACNKNRRPFIKCHWTILEDSLLTELVERFGAGNWEYVAQHIQGRTAKSCRLRWMNHLSPTVDKTPFTAAEHAKLLELQKDFGNKWSTIVRFFPGRTDNQLKNQYNLLVKTRSFKTTVQYASVDDRVDLEGGSINGNLPAVVVGSRLAYAHHVENRYGFCFSSLADIRGHGYDMARPADSVRSDANSGAILELFPVSSKSEEGVRSEQVEFIDFMGVGSSK